MKLSRRAPEPADIEEPSVPAEGKGRPTPKRRESTGVRGPVTAPKTRKEAYARQRTQAKQTKQTRAAARGGATTTGARDMTPAQRRMALRSGEVLSKRDQGATRKLARDYVDSRRLVSNYFLVLFPLLVISQFLGPIVSAITLAVAIGVVGEWWLIGRRIRALAIERFGEAQGGNMSIGFYAGSRAYLPRRWRLPAPQVERGDAV